MSTLSGGSAFDSVSHDASLMPFPTTSMHAKNEDYIMPAPSRLIGHKITVSVSSDSNRSSQQHRQACEQYNISSYCQTI